MTNEPADAQPIIRVSVDEEQRQLSFDLVAGSDPGIHVTEQGFLRVRLVEEAGYSQLLQFVQTNDEFTWAGFYAEPFQGEPGAVAPFGRGPILRRPGRVSGTPFELVSYDQHELVVRDTYADPTSLGVFSYWLMIRKGDQELVYDPEIMNEGEAGPDGPDPEARRSSRQTPRLRPLAEVGGPTG